MIYNIKVYRKAYNLTQQQMAEILGLKKSAISMIENGKREMPPKAGKLFRQLQQKAEGMLIPAKDVKAEPFFTELKAAHQQQSDQYIRLYIGDLQSEKHRLEKQLIKWTEKFNDAGYVLKEAEFMLTGHEKGKFDYSPLLPDLLARKSTAETQLKEVTLQKPELALIRIEGINKELAAAKALLAKRQRFPVLDTVSNIFGKPEEVKKIEDARTEQKKLNG